MSVVTTTTFSLMSNSEVMSWTQQAMFSIVQCDDPGRDYTTAKAESDTLPVFDGNCGNINIYKLEGTGAYGPLLLAPVEGLGGPLGPLKCGGNLF